MGMNGTMRAAIIGGALLALAGPAEAADPPRKTPYFASIAPARARMRTGPGRTFPATWLYVRADLPIRVVSTFKEWRKIEDPGGTQGWMLGTLVSSTRTAIVVADRPVDLHAERGSPKIAWRAAPGVIGRVSRCSAGWCHFDVRGKAGYVETRHLWGVAPEEVLP